MIKKESTSKHVVFSIPNALRFAGGNVNRMKRLIDITRDNSLKRMEQLRKSLDDDDGPEVEITAHTLKGQAANLGAEAFRQLASQIEQSANKGDLDTVREILKGFEKEHDKLMRALEEIDWDLLKNA